MLIDYILISYYENRPKCRKHNLRDDTVSRVLNRLVRGIPSRLCAFTF
jgi:hypothetical protein